MNQIQIQIKILNRNVFISSKTKNLIDLRKIEKSNLTLVKVEKICKRILFLNTRTGVLHAGSSNFPELWTRDFMYSSNILPQIGLQSVLRYSYNFILDYQLPNGQIPVLISFRPITPFKKFLHDNNIVSYNPKIYPKYSTIFNTLDIDSSALSIIYFHNYATVLQKINKYKPDYFFHKLWLAYRYLLSQDIDNDHVIESTPFSGWEDSINTTNFNITLPDILLNKIGQISKKYYSKGSYINVLAIKAFQNLLELAQNLNKDSEVEFLKYEIQNYRKAFFKYFWNGKYIIDFNSSDGGSLDASINVLAIYYNIVAEKQAKTILHSILDLKMNEPFPIINKHGKIKYRRFSIWNRIFQTTSYHESAYWLWVGALFVKALKRYGFEYEEDLHNLFKVILKYKTVFEVYDSNWNPLRGRFNWICAKDFSWSSALILELINDLK